MYECIFAKYDSISSCASIIDSKYSFKCINMYELHTQVSGTYRYIYIISVSEKWNPVIWVNLIITFQALWLHVKMYDILSMTNLHAKYWEIKLSLAILLHLPTLVHGYNEHMFSICVNLFFIHLHVQFMTCATYIMKYRFFRKAYGFPSNMFKYLYTYGRYCKLKIY